MSRLASPSFAPLAAAGRPTILKRIVAALIESRRLAAERELRRLGLVVEPPVESRSQMRLAPRFGR